MEDKIAEMVYNRLLGHTLLETQAYHVENLLSKTGFHTRTELAAEARSLGIVIR